MSDTPAVITRYLQAAQDGDVEALAACFTAAGTALDEGRTHRGHDEIVAWRRSLAAQFTYTADVRGTQAVSPTEFQVDIHCEGDFPGGQVDLTYRFDLEADHIAALRIVE